MKESLNPDAVHSWLSALWPKNQYQNVIAGINDDDCAVLDISGNKLVITTDYLNANPISKQLGIATNRDLGKLLVAANLSDLLGTGAKPIAFLASIMMHKESKLEDFNELMLGIKSELEKYNVPLVGGDTKLGPSDTLCGTAIGICNDPGNLFIKNHAEVGVKIWLSGEVGSVGAAVNGLSIEIMSDEWMDWARNILVSPELPYHKSVNLSKLNLGKGGTDISDGLGENLYDLCESSSVGAKIFADKIPINSKVKEFANILNIPAWYFAFSIGGDFQFLVTTDANAEKTLKELEFIEIGTIEKNTDIIIYDKAEPYTLPRLGHSDYKIKSFSQEVKNMVNTLKNTFNK